MKEVHWQSVETGYSGHGDVIPDVTAEEWAAEMNEKYRTMYHWTVRVLC